MIKRLLRLKPALDFLFANEAHQIDCKHELTAEQWKVLTHIDLRLF